MRDCLVVLGREVSGRCLDHKSFHGENLDEV